MATELWHHLGAHKVEIKSRDGAHYRTAIQAELTVYGECESANINIKSVRAKEWGRKCRYLSGSGAIALVAAGTTLLPSR